MAISLAAAVLGSAIVGGAASVANARSATRSATRAAEGAAASNERIAAATRDTITKLEQPFYDVGTSTLPAILQHLGLPPVGGDSELGGVDWAGYVNNQPDVLENWNALTPDQKAQFNNSPAEFGQYHFGETERLGQPRDLTPFQSAQTTQTATGPAALQQQIGTRPTAAPRPTSTAPTIAPRADTQRTYATTTRPALTAAPGSGGAQAVGGASGGGTGYVASAFDMPTAVTAPSGVNPMASSTAARDYGARPTISAFETSDRPEIEGFTYAERPEFAAADTSRSAFMASDDYDYRQNVANREVGARFSGIGALESGAAMSALAGRYMENYDEWRDTQIAQRNFEAQRGDTNYTTDKGMAQQVWQTVQALRQQGHDNDANRLLTAWQTEQTLRQQGFTADADRAAGDWRAQMQDAGATLRTQIGEAGATQRTAMSEAGATTRTGMTEAGATSRNQATIASGDWRFGEGLRQSAFESDRAFGEDAYRYDTGRTDARYDADRAFDYSTYVDQRNFGNTNYDIDRARGDAIYDTDRGYLTSRYDQTTNNLFGLAGMGQTAAGALAGANTGYANTLINGNTQLAGVQGNAAIANANSVNSAIGGMVNAFGYYAGARGGAPATGGGSSGSAFYYPTTAPGASMGYYG